MVIDQKWLDGFFEEFEYPQGAREALLACIDAVSAVPAVDGHFTQTLEWYSADSTEAQINERYNRLKEIESAVDCPKETVELLFFVLLSQKLERFYEEKSISREIYHQSVLDLKWKLIECYDVFGIWGSFVADWFVRFYSLGRFSIGRLQYEICDIKPIDDDEKGIHVPGGKYINTHIPSAGKLTRENIDASFRDAARFYADEFEGDTVRFCCHSWLLYPKHAEVLPPESGIIQFLHSFDVVRVDIADEPYYAWRIFNTMDVSDLSKLPRDTGLRRIYAKWMEDGVPYGDGFGIRLEKKPQ